MTNKIDNNKKLECRSCGTALKLESPPDGVITFSCEECGSKVSWKISNLTNKTGKHVSHESTGIEFTKAEKSIVKITIIIIILLSALLSFYVFIKK